MKKKYQVGLFVGRFQPFHKGHLWLINKSLQLINSLIIGIGSINVNNNDNLFSFEERKKMIEKVAEKDPAFAKATADEEKIIKIVPLEDFNNDDLWFNHTLRVIENEIDVVVGNNEWTNGIFEKRGYPILRAGFYKRYWYEGEKIRKLMKENKSWEERVPRYLVDYINKTK